MDLKKIKPVKNNLLNVIIETPKGCQNKYSFHEETGLFQLKKTLPMGATFPFDFGFVPNTIGADGDPLDVLVILDEHAYPGCWVKTRIIGVLEAEQTASKNSKTIRNDRIVAIASTSQMFSDVKKIKHLNSKMVKEIEQFFTDYNKNEGKKFKALAWRGRREARKLISKSTER